MKIEFLSINCVRGRVLICKMYIFSKTSFFITCLMHSPYPSDAAAFSLWNELLQTNCAFQRMALAQMQWCPDGQIIYVHLQSINQWDALLY